MKGKRAHLAARVGDVDRAVLVAHLKERHPPSRDRLPEPPKRARCWECDR